jgi:hypothetical protein
MTKERKSVSDIIISRLFSLFCFLILLVVLDYLKKYIDSELYSASVYFLRENMELIVFMGVIYAAGEVFGALVFPLNLPAPIINAVASVFLADFIFRMLSFVGDITAEGTFKVFESFRDYVFPLIFVIVLIGGYLQIFSCLLSKKRKKNKERDE